MHIMLVISQILTILLISSSVYGSDEPLLDILNYHDKYANVSELCHRHLTFLRDGIESDEVWALKGEQKIR
jgi:hypothetical protein